MPIGDDALRDHLLATDPEFAELYRQHRKLDEELTQLVSGPMLSEEQQFREQELKKKKLYLKDKMEFIAYRRSRASAGRA